MNEIPIWIAAPRRADGMAIRIYPIIGGGIAVFRWDGAKWSQSKGVDMAEFMSATPASDVFLAAMGYSRGAKIEGDDENRFVRGDYTRIDRKLIDRRPSEIADYLGYRISANTDAVVEALIQGLRSKGTHIIDVNDFRYAEHGSGYRAVHLQIATGGASGASYELQILPRPINDVLTDCEQIYAGWRNRIPLTRKESEAAITDMRKVKKIFDDAWKQWPSAS